ncbi:MAG: hypothetical protein K0S51_103 [Bacillales bacterium]|jgi:hypothetical protein|nr:hypothetical protein [Bacillales bacterium]
MSHYNRSSKENQPSDANHVNPKDKAIQREKSKHQKDPMKDKYPRSNQQI